MQRVKPYSTHIATRKRKQQMTFIQVLNNPAARDLVDQIEDVAGSLRGKQGDKVLEAIQASLIAELFALTGFTYTI